MLKNAPLLFLLLYITKIRETASLSFERVATNRERVHYWMLLNLIEKKIETNNVSRFYERVLRLGFLHKLHAVPSTRITIERTLSLSKWCNEIFIKKSSTRLSLGVREYSRKIAICHDDLRTKKSL